MGSGTLQNVAHDTGFTNRFAYPIPTNPDGSIASSAYDGVANDCYLWTATGHASTSNMHASSFVTGLHQLQVRFWGGANNPLTPSPEINWDHTIDLTAVPGYPALYTIRYTHDCFPAHEAWIKDQQLMYGFTPGSSDPVTVTYCLSGFGQITGQNTSQIY